MLRAATVAGAGAVAYHAGKKTQAGRDQDAAQDEQTAQTQSQAAPSPPAPAASGLSEDALEKLKQLGQLHDQGVLSDAEFEAQKAKVLGN